MGGEHEACMSVLVREPGRMPAYSWESNIQVGLKGIGFVGVNWIELADDRVCCLLIMNIVMNLHRVCCLMIMNIVMNLQFKLRNIGISRMALLWSNKQ